MGQVRGILFADYVRMLRREFPSWRDVFPADVRAVLETRVDLDAWYPMEHFEKLGLLILEHVVGRERDSVRLWGRWTVQAVLGFIPELANADDPRDSVMRFQNFLASLFDFPALTVESVDDESAVLRIEYGMSAPAEEAASWQAVGFFEELVVASGGRKVTVTLTEAKWEGAPTTRVTLGWLSSALSPRPLVEHPRVLVVDDERLVARALARLLAKVADVTFARSADEALGLLSTRTFDTVLSDFNMPGADGLALLTEVAQRWPHLKRVLHTALATDAARDALRSGVVDELLDKPASRDVLIAAVSTPPPRAKT